MKRTKLLLLFLLASASTFTLSCLETPVVELPNTFTLFLQVTGTGADITDGVDTVIVVNNAFVINGINLTREGQDPIEFENTEVVASFSDLVSDTDQAIASAEIPSGAYATMFLNISPPNDETLINQPNLVFRDSNGNYLESFSIFIQGVYRREAFEFRSKIDIDREFEFSDTFVLNEFNSSISVVMRLDMDDWFRNSEGRILDPSNSLNTSAISQNIVNSIRVESKALQVAGSTFQ